MATNNAVNTGLSGSTGTGSFVGSTSPSLVTPLLGTPTSGTLTNCTGLPVGTGVSGLGSGVATFLGTPSSANLATAVTDESGSGALVFGTSPTFVTPTLGAATATSLTFSPTTSGIVGTTTNDDAAAGKVGEFVSSTVLLASGITLVSATPANVTTISLTAGDWDVSGSVFLFNATFSNIQSWINNVSATPPDSAFIGSVAVAGLAGGGIIAPKQRFSLSGTTTIYLSCTTIVTSGTGKACGFITARRRR